MSGVSGDTTSSTPETPGQQPPPVQITSVTETPVNQDTASTTTQPSAMNVEPSRPIAVTNETPTLLHLIAQSTTEQNLFVTPNLAETPPLVCPGAPQRPEEEPIDPVVPTPVHHQEPVSPTDMETSEPAQGTFFTPTTH